MGFTDLLQKKKKIDVINLIKLEIQNIISGVSGGYKKGEI